MEAAPIRRQGTHLDRLTLWDDGSERLHLDEAVTEVLDARLKVWSDAMHAEIRAPELDHPARVVPAILIPAVFAHEDGDVMSGHGSRRLESRFAPLLRAPPFECVG